MYINNPGVIISQDGKTTTTYYANPVKTKKTVVRVAPNIVRESNVRGAKGNYKKTLEVSGGVENKMVVNEVVQRNPEAVTTAYINRPEYQPQGQTVVYYTTGPGGQKTTTTTTTTYYTQNQYGPSENITTTAYVSGTGPKKAPKGGSTTITKTTTSSYDKRELGSVDADHHIFGTSGHIPAQEKSKTTNY